MLRNDGNHRFLARTSEAAWPEASRRKGQAQRRQDAERGQEPSFATCAAVRASALITHFSALGAAIRHIKGHVAAKPLQSWLNRAHAVDKAACTGAVESSYGGAILVDGRGDLGEQDEDKPRRVPGGFVGGETSLAETKIFAYMPATRTLTMGWTSSSRTRSS